MINTYIINGLNPHEKINESDMSPEYFMIIKKATQKTECNQDYLEFDLVQVNQKLSDIIDNTSNFNKKLSITGVIEIDDNDLLSTKLIGFESGSDNSQVNNPVNTSHYIEVVETQLEKEIEIDFSREYIGQKEEITTLLDEEGQEIEGTKKIEVAPPSVIVNIDKQYENLYRSYSTEYKKDGQDNYIGVKIYFNNLKSKKNYPMVRINIIGEKNPNYQEDINIEEESD